ncbi:MAG TPA: hypothetical protein VF335_08720 [Chitinivibrionales bacterium]
MRKAQCMPLRGEYSYASWKYLPWMLYTLLNARGAAATLIR